MVLDPIPQSLPVQFFGSRPQPPTSPLRSDVDLCTCIYKQDAIYDAISSGSWLLRNFHQSILCAIPALNLIYVHVYTYMMPYMTRYVFVQDFDTFSPVNSSSTPRCDVDICTCIYVHDAIYDAIYMSPWRLRIFTRQFFEHSPLWRWYTYIHTKWYTWRYELVRDLREFSPVNSSSTPRSRKWSRVSSRDISNDQFINLRVNWLVRHKLILTR